MIKITPSPYELAAAEVRMAEHLVPHVVRFAGALGITGDLAFPDGKRALRAALVVALRQSADNLPLAPLQARTVTAHLATGKLDLVVVPVPAGRLETHNVDMVVALAGADVHVGWRFLLDGTRLLAVEPPATHV